jgi:hypothetical protein
MSNLNVDTLILAAVLVAVSWRDVIRIPNQVRRRLKRRGRVLKAWVMPKLDLRLPKWKLPSLPKWQRKIKTLEGGKSDRDKNGPYR